MKRTLLLIAILFSAKVFSQTTIDEGSLVSGVWTRAAAPYLINGSIMIPEGETLTIEPGVQINFEGSYKLIVAGRLLAVGTATDSISFSPSDSSIGWLGISFENADNTDSSLIKFCNITYANTEGINGAGISISNSFKIAISNCTINNCNSTKYGSAIFSTGSDPVITNNNITFNHSIAGAIFLNGKGTISNNYIAYNDNVLLNGPGPGLDPDNYGAGIVAIGEYSNPPLISYNTITQNISSSNGGGITVSGYVDVINNSITYNHATSIGGGIYCLDCSNISGNAITNNSAPTGAGIHIYNNADIDIQEKYVDNNVISNNTAVYGGGGISINGGWQIYLTHNKIFNNAVTTAGTTYQGGGGIWLVSSSDHTVQFSDNIISNNSSILGGGICLVGLQTASFFNNTITNNAASSKGGGLYFYSSSPELYSNIVWGNTAVANNGGNQVYLFNEASDPNFYNNDIQGSTTGFGKNGTFFTGKYQNNINSNPGFVSPTLVTGNAYNGVNADWSLQDTSKCINTGYFGQPISLVLEPWPETKDIVGNPREVNCKIDIGAIENQVHLLLPSGIGFTNNDYTYNPWDDSTYTCYNPPILQSFTNIIGNQFFNKFYWNTGDTTSTLQVAENGWYKLRATSNTGCNISDSTFIIVKPLANFTPNIDTQCLANNNFIFKKTAKTDTLNYNYKWNFGDATISTDTVASHTYTNPGIYTVKLIVSQKKYNTCKDSVSKVIKVDQFTFNPLTDTTVVENDSVTLNAGYGYASYRWNNDSASQSIIVKEKGWYKISVTNNNGCTATDSSYVLFKKRKTLFIDKNENNCPNSTNISVSVRTLNFTNIVGLQGTINWSTSKLKFKNVVYNSSNINISPSDLNLTQTNNGYLTLSWLDNTLQGKYNPDSAQLFTLNFDIQPGNTLGSQIPISFGSSPTTLEIDTVNLATTTLTKALDAKYTNGYVQIVASPKISYVSLEACDSIVYKGVKYTQNTSIVDTLKYTQGCDSVYKNVSMTIYDAPLTPTVYITSTSNSILYGNTVSFISTRTKGGDNPLFQWYKNGVAIDGATDSIYTTSALNANDTIYVSIKSSLSCAVTDSIVSNKVLVNVSYAVSGKVNHLSGSTVPNTTLIVDNITSTLPSQNFSKYLSGGTKHTIRFSKNNDINKTNGVSTLDIALIQSHILNISPFDNPFKFLAADVDNSGEISALDILHIRRLILGTAVTFPNNRLWSFFDSSNINQQNPYPVKDSITFDSLMSTQTNLQFIGVKLGDVNFDWNPVQSRPFPINTTPIKFYHDDIYIDNNGEIRVPIRIQDFRNILAMQYTMNFNNEKLQFDRIENNNLNLQFATNKAEEGNLSFIWNDPGNKPINLEDGSKLMDIIFIKKEDIIEETLNINSNIASVEAWDNNFQKHLIKMGRGKIISDIKKVWTVSPNPTHGIVNINILSKDNRTILLELKNVFNQTLKTYAIKLIPGNNMTTIDLRQSTPLPAGIYYLHIVGATNECSRKVIIQ